MNRFKFSTKTAPIRRLGPKIADLFPETIKICTRGLRLAKTPEKWRHGAKMSKYTPKPLPNHVRTTSEPRPNHITKDQIVSPNRPEPHPNHIRTTSEPRLNQTFLGVFDQNSSCPSSESFFQVSAFFKLDLVRKIHEMPFLLWTTVADQLRHLWFRIWAMSFVNPSKSIKITKVSPHKKDHTPQNKNGRVWWGDVPQRVTSNGQNGKNSCGEVGAVWSSRPHVTCNHPNKKRP